MRFKRAIGIAALTYVASFLIGIVVASASGINLLDGQEPTATQWIISIVFTLIIVALFSLWYFSGKGVSASAKEGFYLGLVFFVAGWVLDFILALPLLLSGSSASQLIAYYSNPLFWVSVVLIVLVPVVVGAVKKR